MTTQPAIAPPDKALNIVDPRFEAYRGQQRLTLLINDALAGLVVALVAIPLGIGFAIASGLSPEQGIIAGAAACILGGLFGGSKYQVYGPTAAFIPLLSSVVSQYGTSFLIMSSLIAGAIIILMGIFKLGDLFSKIPFSITVGFTLGIALSIGLGQLPDALGSLHTIAPHTLEKIGIVYGLLLNPNLYTLAITVLVFFIIRTCYKTSVLIPGPLIAIGFALLLSNTLLQGQNIPLVATKFGSLDGNIFKLTLPVFASQPWWVWIKPVLSIVFIASLESLLSARMADRLAGNKTPFNANRELVGQGLVNMIVPLLNGFPCTGAFARTATSIKAGAISPAASLFKGSFVIILMVFFAHYVSIIPMACISGLLLYVATNMVKMEEVRHVFHDGRLHTFFMLYTAGVTFISDLFIAVSTATLLYSLIVFWKKRSDLRASFKVNSP
jgi:sulfate permease, SulP family